MKKTISAAMLMTALLVCILSANAAGPPPLRRSWLTTLAPGPGVQTPLDLFFHANGKLTVEIDQDGAVPGSWQITAPALDGSGNDEFSASCQTSNQDLLILVNTRLGVAVSGFTLVLRGQVHAAGTPQMSIDGFAAGIAWDSVARTFVVVPLGGFQGIPAH